MIGRIFVDWTLVRLPLNLQDDVRLRAENENFPFLSSFVLKGKRKGRGFLEVAREKFVPDFRPNFGRTFLKVGFRKTQMQKDDLFSTFSRPFVTEELRKIQHWAPLLGVFTNRSDLCGLPHGLLCSQKYHFDASDDR